MMGEQEAKSQPYISTEEAAKRIYTNIIKTWLNYQINTKITKNSQQTSHYFHASFKPKVHKDFKLKVVKDNLAADVIITLLYQDICFWKCLQDESQMQMEKTYRQSITNIVHTLFIQKFIIKRKYLQIMEILEDDMGTPTQKGVYSVSTNISETMGNKEKLKYWEKNVCIKLSKFWELVCHQYQILCSADFIKKLFKCYKGILRNYLKQLDFQKLCDLLCQKNKRWQCLQKVANDLDFFRSKDVQRVQNEVEIIKYRIKQVVFPDACIRIQPYGSYRSNFCMVGSDVDLAILITELKGYNQEPKFIQDRLWKIYHKMKNSIQKISCIKIAPVINNFIKVPFIMLKFSQQKALQSMDLVVNNINGVINSQFFYHYSKNDTIKKLGLLTKKWAKKQSLIHKTKLSSYGVLYLTIYYLMKNGHLNYIKPHQIQDINFSFSNTLNKEHDLFKLFKGFFQFYSGPFFENDEILCLLQNCTNHSHLKTGFVIDMHDPFDGTNPGRLKQYDRYSFMNSVARMVDYLASIKEEEGEKLLSMFDEQKPVEKKMITNHIDIDENDFI